MSAEQQLERPSRFKAGARVGPGKVGDGSHSSTAATDLLGGAVCREGEKAALSPTVSPWGAVGTRTRPLSKERLEAKF